MAEAAEQELDAYQQERFHAARAAGLTRVEAFRFAQGQETLRTLRQLRERGCPPAVIARIVC